MIIHVRVCLCNFSYIFAAVRLQYERDETATRQGDFVYSGSQKELDAVWTVLSRQGWRILWVLSASLERVSAARAEERKWWPCIAIINGCIKGIFLGVNVDLKTGQLPMNSPFGYLRFRIPIESLYGHDFHLYFADFYCHIGSKSHHLTLVITRANSAADMFCEYHLPKLDRTHNPFLYQDPVTGQMMHTTMVWIEILYTEMIPININGSWLDRVQCNSSNMKMGKSKNAACPVCNI